MWSLLSKYPVLSMLSLKIPHCFSIIWCLQKVALIVVVFVGGPAKYYKANILKTQEAITKSRLCDHLTNPRN